jgi:hypothetical protein
LGVRGLLIQKEMDAKGKVLEEVDENERLKVARAGDYLMIPFQCKVCNFRNKCWRKSKLVPWSFFLVMLGLSLFGHFF